MESLGRDRWEAEYYKFGSGHTCVLMFMEELFSLVTLQMYPCKNGRIFETWKNNYHSEVLNHKTIPLWKRNHFKKHKCCTLIIFFSGTYKLFSKRLFLLVKNISTIWQCIFFHVLLTRTFNMNSPKRYEHFFTQYEERKYHSCVCVHTHTHTTIQLVLTKSPNLKFGGMPMQTVEINPDDKG
jgi:hypothetical protein